MVWTQVRGEVVAEMFAPPEDEKVTASC
jgi:hypothetical protein